jgi:hypothetical protein
MLVKKARQDALTTRVKHIAVGFKMKEGLTCIAYDHTRKVAFAVQIGSYEPYVTWKYDWDPDHLEYVFWAGHYFRDVVNAATDFRERP